MLRHAWAKLNGEGMALPLADHAADVASVLRRLLAEPAWTERLGRCAGRPLAPLDLDRLATLAFLHDLGKANVGFWEQQFPGKPRVGHTSETAPLFCVPSVQDGPVPSQLLGLLEAWGAEDLFRATMAHHGRPLEVYADGELGKTARNRLKANNIPAAYWRSRDGYDPLEQLAQLLDAAVARFPATSPDGPGLPDAAAFVSLFCGLVTLADWLGSDTSLFPVARPDGPERDAAREAAATAAVVGRGLATLGTPPCDFAGAFGLSPRGIQAAADDPGLGPVALIEAETGSGKTEAALWRWLALRRTGAVDGLYFALPTRSAAVQLHGRVQGMLDRVFGSGAVAAVLAVPGYIRAGDAEGQALPEFGVAWEDDRTADGRWAAERPKRFLAARVAVGTIDQALMAGLQLRHAHLRAAALSRNLLVIDEVHASDAFMGEVLGQVLRNHVALGGHALLLSATLTAEARSRLLSRPCIPILAEAYGVDYPALSGTTCGPVGAGRTEAAEKPVALEAWPSIDDAVAVAARAVEAARAGASVLVVRNSVAGAIAVAKAVEDAAPDLAFRVGGASTLHHGRFAPGDRRLLDAAVEAAFGKKRDAQGRILCGTQTLEQSLDIDADLLLTDLAPMDVLLQRVGRLHRHAGRERGAFGQARAVVLVPAERDLSAYLGPVRNRHGLGPLRDGTGVYPDLLVLEATLRLIESNPAVSIPQDNRRLVEGALHREVLDGLRQELGTAWVNHAAILAGGAAAERGLAKSWCLDLTEPFGTLLFRDEDEAIATRLGTRDRLVDFDPTFAGPFGAAVERLTVPGWMAPGVPAEAGPVLEGTGPDGVLFRLADRTFLYGRWGLEAGADQI